MDNQKSGPKTFLKYQISDSKETLQDLIVEN